MHKAKTPSPEHVVLAGHALGLKLTKDGGLTRCGFRWPLTVGAVVEAPDWRDDRECGGGLHFWPWGEGDANCCDYLSTAGHGLVIDYVDADSRPLDGKSKVARCTIVFVGKPREAAAWLATYAKGRAIILGTATAGDSGTATAGYSGTATAGDSGTATAGDRGTATAGDRGTATAGYSGTATAGDSGTATAGDRGTATAGDRGTATAGYSGTATAGDSGTATAGDSGTATAGYSGTATAGYSGTATAGDSGTATAGPDGVLSILWWDEKQQRYRRQVGIVGEGSLKPWHRYRLDSAGQWVEGKEIPETERPTAVLAAAYAKAKGARNA